VRFVASGSSILAVVPENDALAIEKSVLKRVSVPARILWVVSSVDFPPDDELIRSVFDILDDLERRSSHYGMFPINIEIWDIFHQPVRNRSATL